MICCCLCKVGSRIACSCQINRCCRSQLGWSQCCCRNDDLPCVSIATFCPGYICRVICHIANYNICNRRTRYFGNADIVDSGRSLCSARSIVYPVEHKIVHSCTVNTYSSLNILPCRLQIKFHRTIKSNPSARNICCCNTSCTACSECHIGRDKECSHIVIY